MQMIDDSGMKRLIKYKLQTFTLSSNSLNIIFQIFIFSCAAQRMTQIQDSIKHIFINYLTKIICVKLNSCPDARAAVQAIFI